MIPQGWGGELGHAVGGVIEGPAGVGRLDPVLGMEAQPDAGTDGEGFVRFRLREEELFHFLGFLRHLLGEVMHLGEILREIIEFPHGFAGIPFVESGLGVQPRAERAEGAGIPAILIDAVAAVVVEILDVFVFRCFRIAEGRSHAHPVDGILRKTVDRLRGLDADEVVERRGDVVDVVKLRARPCRL